MEVYESRAGAKVLRLHYSCDPEKGSQWAEEAKRGMPHREWQREFEMDTSIYDGEPVFPEFSDAIHAPAAQLPILSGGTAIGGWDCGTSGLDLAFVLFQVTRAPFQVHALWEMVSTGPESMTTFAPRVYRALSERFPSLVHSIKHVGDPTGGNRQGANGLSSFSVARQCGIVIKPSTNSWADRHGAVVWGLTDWIDSDTPRFLIAREGCPVLLEGLRGAYQYRLSSTADDSGPGRVLLQPLKNSYSHVNDAFQYGMVTARRLILGQTGCVRGRFGDEFR